MELLHLDYYEVDLQTQWKYFNNVRWRRWGSSLPINTSGILLAHVSAKSASNIFPKPSKVIHKFSKHWDNF